MLTLFLAGNYLKFSLNFRVLKAINNVVNIFHPKVSIIASLITRHMRVDEFK